jgi:hydrogenase nickel incorporation protein HypA/HybF
MHELSIVNSLLSLCEENAKTHNAKKITKVEIKVGRLSGIEPHFLKLTFDTFKEKTICEGAELVMNIQDIIIKCLSCGAEDRLVNNEFICTRCGSNNIKVEEGEDMLLMRLEME